MGNTVKELRVIAKEMNIKGYSNMKKEDLIKVIAENQKEEKVINLEDMTMAEILKVASSKNLTFKIGEKKEAIVKAIKDLDKVSTTLPKEETVVKAAKLSSLAEKGLLENDPKEVEKAKEVINKGASDERAELQKKISNYYKSNGYKMYVRNEIGSVTFRLDNATKVGDKVIFTATNPFKKTSKITLDALLDKKFLVITPEKAKAIADKMITLNNHFRKVAEKRYVDRPSTYTVDIKGEEVFVHDRIRNKTEKAATTERAKRVIKKATYLDSKGNLASAEYAVSTLSSADVKDYLAKFNL